MRDTTAPKPFVFVLMPFDQSFRDVYELGIRAACSAAGAYCERVDEQIFDESILQRVYNQIAKADLVVADMTHRNPNVFYEVGYAHALGKRVILITRDAADIPFDLKHYPHIVHEGSIATLKTDLQRRVLWFVENPDSPLQSALDFRFLTAGRAITAGSVVVFDLPSDDPNDVTIAFDVNNPTDRVIDAARAEIGIVVPEALRNGYGDNVSSVRIDARHWMHLFSGLGSILPGGWRALRLRCRRRSLDRHRDRDLQIVLRTFAEVGYRDTPFVIRFTSREDEVTVIEDPTASGPKTA